jgi:hypothetical protein
MTLHLTLDVESRLHLCRMEGTAFDAAEVERQVEGWLRFLDAAGVRATFFVLGEVAAAAPGLVRAVAEAGHEVAAHGHLHRPVHRLSREQFREDLRRCKGILEGIAGAAVKGYRSPAWTLGLASEGHYGEVEAAGFRYSSSLLPATGFRRRRPVGPFPEFPPCTARLGPLAVPLGTSWVGRMVPLRLLELHLKGPSPHILVAHAHELAPCPPDALGWGASFIRYAAIETHRERLGDLLRLHGSAPLASLLS